MQTHRQSLFETVVNIASGMVIAFCITQAYQALVPGVSIPLGQNVILTVILTTVSVLRSYCWRRFFNKVHSK